MILKQFQEYSQGHLFQDIAIHKLHHRNGRYTNPFNSHDPHGIRRMSQIIYWKLFSKNRYTNFYDKEKVAPVSIEWSSLNHHDGLSVTWLKHACLLIKDQGIYLLVDPLFNGLFGLFKDFTPFDFDVSLLPKPHHVLITHGHYDHLDKSSLNLLEKSAHIITPLGYDEIFRNLKMFNRNQLDWFETYSADGCRITLLPSHHWTMRNPIFGPNRELWGSYLIETSSGSTLYIAGDTAYFDEFAEIGKRYNIDLAIFNLGAYEPRWFMAGSHMNPEETVCAFELLAAKKFMIVHWGTFRLGDEPVFLPPVDLKEVLDAKGLTDRWIPILHGQTINEHQMQLL